MADLSQVAGLMAQTGGNIGQSIGGALSSFGKGLGGMLTERGQRKQREEDAKEALKFIEENSSNPAKLNAMSQKYMTEGNTELAKVFQRAAQAATKKIAGRGKGELMALANNPKFDITNQTMQSGYLGMANAFDISREEAMKIALEALKTREDRDKAGDTRTFASAGRYKDEDDNIYVATEVRNKAGGVTIDYSPVTPNAPDKPEGKLTPIGGAYSLSAAERISMEEESAGRTTKAEGFAKSQQEAVDSLPKIEISIGNAEQSLALLKQIKTGGFTTAIVRAAQRFLGVEPKTQAEFNLLAGKTVLDNLSKFEGAISEGERRYLENLYQSLERSGGANQGILESLLQEAQFYLADAKAKAGASSYNNYLETRPTYSSVTAQGQGPQKVNFGDLK